MGKDFECWTTTRIEDLGRRKANIGKRKFDNEEDVKEDEKWIKTNRSMINEEIKLLRDRNIQTKEKIEQGWKLCKAELAFWDTRRPGVKGQKRKKQVESPQGGKDSKIYSVEGRKKSTSTSSLQK